MIRLSPSAIKEILRLRSKQSSQNSKFRLSIATTGCLSKSYIMSFDRVHTDDLEIVADDALDVVVNPADVPYLEGLAIDYSEDMMGGGFRFQNPNAMQVCSCGNSFSVRD